MRDRGRDSVLPALIAHAPEIPTLHVLASVLDAAQAAIRNIWGEDEYGELRASPPYEQEAELARDMLQRIAELALTARRYHEAIIWRVPHFERQPDPMDRSAENPAEEVLPEVDDTLF